jgi:hypothetical protein
LIDWGNFGIWGSYENPKSQKYNYYVNRKNE